MKQSGTRHVIEWGHLALLAAIVGVVVAYLLDARATSLRTNNLLLVQPVAILALVLAALVLPQIVRRLPADEAPDAGARRRARAELLRIGLLAIAFGGFVFSLERIGFDVATFVFVALGLWICGERRPWVVGLYAAVFTASIIFGYQQLVPYPFPLSVL